MKIFAIALPKRADTGSFSALEIAPKAVVNQRDALPPKRSRDWISTGKRWWSRYEKHSQPQKPVAKYFFFCKIDDSRMISEKKRLDDESRVMRWATKASNTWHSWGQAEKTSWKYKTWQTSMTVLNQISWEEWFLKSVPYQVQKTASVTLRIPSDKDSGAAMQELETLLSTRVPYHQKRFNRTLYLLPLTLIVAIVGPNFPFLINLFRVWSHYTALHGAKWLQRQFPIKIESESELDIFKADLGKIGPDTPEKNLQESTDANMAHKVHTLVQDLQVSTIKDAQFSEHYMRAYLQTRSRIRRAIYKESIR